MTRRRRTFSMPRRFLLLAALCSMLSPLTAPADASRAREQSRVLIRGDRFVTVLPPGPSVKEAVVADFWLDRTPVTNEQFSQFVQRHPEWRRDRIARVFADDDYLRHWQSATEPGATIRRQPAVRVSWFAAAAYCESRGARLPTWYEWEYVAAASESKRDARDDAAWRQRILTWYSQSARAPLPDVGSTAPNFHGVRDLHGVIWEWVSDSSSLLVSGDNRQQSEADSLRYCGPGALTMEQKENYATLMRIAMLSSMQARYTGAVMGFRCAADAERAAR